MVLLASDLSPLEADEIYQMWLGVGETPTSAGTLSVQPDGVAAVLVDTDRAIESFHWFGILVEMRPGSQQPEGPVMMFGALAGATP